MNIPHNTRKALERYVTHGVLPGRFLQAVLRNEFVEAINYADPDNRTALVDIANHVVNVLPGNCWGSRETVSSWVHAHVQERDRKEAEPCATE